MIVAKTQAAFEALYAGHAASVERFVCAMVGNRAVAEELTQESFLKAWRALPNFAFRSSLKTWVFSVALNTARDWLRAHPRRTVTDDVAETGVDASLSPEARAIREALLELDDDNRALLVFHYYEDLGLKDISRILEIPEGTVKSRLFHAKARLRERLRHKGFEL